MKGDEEIITALNHCAQSNTDIHKCVGCPLFGNYTDCMQRLIIGANELVRRLTSRTERLKTTNKKLKNKSEVKRENE